MNNRYWQLLGLRPTRDCAFINAAFLEQISHLQRTGDSQEFRRLQDAREYALLYAADQAPALDPPYLIEGEDNAAARAAFRRYDDFADLLLNRPAEHDTCGSMFQAAAGDETLSEGARLQLITWLAALLYRHKVDGAMVNAFDRAFGLRGRLPVESSAPESLRFWYMQTVDVIALGTAFPKWTSLAAAAMTACVVYLLLTMVFDRGDGYRERYSAQEFGQYLNLESTPRLAWAINHGDLELTRMALKSGADANGLVPGERMPLLVLAANQGYHHIVSELLAQGADQEVGDEYGFQAIHHAVANNDEEMVSLFLKYGANPYRKGDMGFSAMDMAHNFRHYHLVDLIAAQVPAGESVMP